MQRKDEILAKKAKLAELRRQREEREQRHKESGSKRESILGDPSEGRASTPSRTTDRKELDSFIETLVGERVASGTSSPAGRKSRPSSTFGAGQVGTETYERASSGSQPPVQTASAGTQTLSTAPVETNYDIPPSLPTKPRVEVTTYSKGVQTSDPWSPQRRRRSSEGFSDSERDQSPTARSPRASKRLSRREREREEELRQNLRREIEEELKAVKDLSLDGPIPTGPSKFPARGLTDEEVNAVTASEEFLDFVERSSKVIEKALDQDYDVLADYALDGADGIDEDEDEGYRSSLGKKGRRIKQVAQFYDERWSKKRMISDMCFSPKFPELLLASYTKNPSAPQDPSGLLQVWNMHLHSRPEYTFHSTSDILTAKFSPFHPSLVIGGSYSGQVLLWDTRSRTPLPVQKTPLTGASTGGHTHPVYSISLVGTQNANNIISCSTDGVVCGWTVDMLSLPQEYLELTAPPPSKTEDLSPTCMSFPISDPTSFLVGTEEGTIYPCHRYDRAGAKAGVDTRLRYRGHTAPVMSLDFHPARGPVDLGDLVLSSALDWTVKLWKTRASTSTAVATSTTSSILNPNTNNEQTIEPLMEFSREDIVYDARWSPHKPGVFSSVDGAGNVEVWDLTVDTEVPVTRATPEISRSIQGGYVAKSLERVTWEEKEGKRLGVGGAAGVVTVFEVGSELAGESVRNEEWTRMKRLVSRVEAGR
ncbi:hypothetical protein OEA41_010299 [Lepraria neglecta]|uniref:Cytoplasmic dynein intermediate chain n=1 Tax=Lepraria neglecta TaxID=209136 RepID=A0AAE0DHK6_9LECA|nr:hypothetical protein OEA41_010299 [Lepraria neglecta]